MLRSLLIAAVLVLGASPARAEVVERGTDHFTLRHAVALEASPADIIDALEHVGDWWNPAHTYSGDSGNLSLALDPGTCLCEAMPDGSTIDHGGVYEYDPATGVIFDAPLGPLKGRVSLASWTISWTGANRGTELTMSFVVRGDGIGTLADSVDAVMVEQFRRMVRFIEYGEV